MSYFDTFITLDFQGSDRDIKKLKALLKLMDKEDKLSDEDLDNSPYKFEEIWGNALLGELTKKGNKKYYWYVPNYISGLGFAPQLIASLFPDCSFSYQAEVYDSVSTEGDMYYKAEYNNHIFVEETYSGDDIYQACEDYLNENKLHEDKISSKEMGQILEKVKRNSRRTILPARNALYEQSFCGDISIDAFLSNA